MTRTVHLHIASASLKLGFIKVALIFGVNGDKEKNPTTKPHNQPTKKTQIKNNHTKKTNQATTEQCKLQFKNPVACINGSL